MNGQVIRISDHSQVDGYRFFIFMGFNFFSFFSFDPEPFVRRKKPSVRFFFGFSEKSFSGFTKKQTF
jgi:hypothetical protein